MDNHLMIFESTDFGRVRSVLKDGAPWFVAVDVCKALGLNQVTRAMSRLDSDEGGLLEVPHPQNADKTIEINAVSEAGLYHLILCSKKPEARAFKRWITHEVIPSIRKHGAYMTDSLLDALYETFNIRRPEDFRGHSLSVSDIVALKQNGVVSCHYVDSRGFKALPDFLKPENYLKNAEMAMEDDYGMIDGVINNGPKQTVAELEEQAKSGKPVSLMELAQAARREQAQASRQEKKPSVLAKLCPPVNEPKKTARSKRAERELL